MITKFKLFESDYQDWLKKSQDPDGDLTGSDDWITLQKDARKQTLLGKHIKHCYMFEDQRYGFELEDKSRIFFDEKYNHIEYELPNGDYIWQKAWSQYDFEDTFRSWKDGKDGPIFLNIEDGRKFVNFCQKYLSQKPKIKLKYLLTQDYKENKIPVVSKKDIEDKVLNKVVTVREIDDIVMDGETTKTTYKDVHWTCTRVNYTPDENRLWNFVALQFEDKDKEDFMGFNMSYKIYYMIDFSEMGDITKEETELLYGNTMDDNKENYINRVPEFKTIVKELSKLFKSK